MPFSFRFFSEEADSRTFEQNLPIELSLEDLIALGNEIATISLTYDKIRSAMSRTSMDHTRTLQHLHYLHHCRWFIEIQPIEMQNMSIRHQVIGEIEHHISNTIQALFSIEQSLENSRRKAGSITRNRARLLNLFQEEQLRHLTFSQAILNDTSAYQHLLSDLNPVIIQDIIVTHPGLQPPGEISGLIEDEGSYLERMMQQIELLVSFAKDHHQMQCDETTREGMSCEDVITRIVTDEFSFYPYQPLTIRSYLYLLRRIYDLAKTLPLNVHLILSSFPVLDETNLLHNLTVHITCGTTPNLHHHSKAIASTIDISYGHNFGDMPPPSLDPHMPKINFEEPLKFSSGTIVMCTTSGGTRFITNMEICIEHNSSIGIECLSEVVRRGKLAKDIIPLQYSHVVSSRSTLLSTLEPKITRATQADAIAPGIWLRDPQTQVFSSSAPDSIVQLANFFGTECYAHVVKPQQVSFLPDDILQEAAANNVQMIENQLLNIHDQPNLLI